MKNKHVLLFTVLAVILSTAVVPWAFGQNVKVLIPHESWNCGMAEGIPAPESGNLVFQLEMKFDKVLDVGKTPFGDRKVIVAQEGTVSGPKLTGSVMPGALDFELKLSNGTIETEQIFVLKTSDGKYVYARNAGTGADSSCERSTLGVAQFREICRTAHCRSGSEDADTARLRCLKRFSFRRRSKCHAHYQARGHSQSAVGLSKAGTLGETRRRAYHRNGDTKPQPVCWHEQEGKSKHHPDYWRRTQRAHPRQGAVRRRGLSESLGPSGYRCAVSLAGE
jgi:hypothetical protein